MPEPSTVSEPALTLTVPVLLKLPTQKLLARPRVCVPATFLFSVPALVNTGAIELSIATGVAWVLAMSNLPPAWFTKVGEVELELNANNSRSSPPSVTVPALSHRRLSAIEKLPPVAVRLMLLVEPAGVSSVPLPRRAAAAPLAVSVPVTATVPLPPSTGLAPVRVRLEKAVVNGALMLSVALSTVRTPGSPTAPEVDATLSVLPLRLSAVTPTALPADRLALPADCARLGTVRSPAALRMTVPALLMPPEATARLPLALTVSEEPDSTVVGSRVVPASALLAVRFVIRPATPTVIDAPPAGSLASVRVPPNSMAVPAAIA